MTEWGLWALCLYFHLQCGFLLLLPIFFIPTPSFLSACLTLCFLYCYLFVFCPHIYFTSSTQNVNLYHVKIIWYLTFKNAVQICSYVQIHPPSCPESHETICLLQPSEGTVLNTREQKEETRAFTPLFLCISCTLSSVPLCYWQMCYTLRFESDIPCLDFQ